jgi:peptide/nickel transport system ATP-binding protein
MRRLRLAKELIQILNLEKSFLSRTSGADALSLKRVGFIRKEQVYALNGINLTVYKGECLCVVGETGCGKSTLARVLMGLEIPSSGEVRYQGDRIDTLNDRQRMDYRKKMQMVFQSPYASLNPRMTVYQMLHEAVSIHHPQFSSQDTDQFIANLLVSVGLTRDVEDKYPHEFSGGQRQRISLARALSVEPEFIVADEPLAALDVSVQAQVLNLMMEKKDQLGLTYLFITHDLAVVEHFATRVSVMYLGTICEVATREVLFQSPKHPYTKALLSSTPRLDNLQLQPIVLKGEVPAPTEKLKGCAFSGRCPYANQRCYEQVPESRTFPDGSSVACHAVEEGRIVWK